MTTVKHLFDLRKDRYELVDEPINQSNRIFISKKLITRVTMDFRARRAREFRKRLWFKQSDDILTKEQSVLIKKSSFEEENMQTQYSLLGYRIHLYFHDYRFTIKIDENGHNNRNADYETKSQKTIEHELGCGLIRIDPNQRKSWDF